MYRLATPVQPSAGLSACSTAACLPCLVACLPCSIASLCGAARDARPACLACTCQSSSASMRESRSQCTAYQQRGPERGGWGLAQGGSLLCIPAQQRMGPCREQRCPVLRVPLRHHVQLSVQLSFQMLLQALQSAGQDGRVQGEVACLHPGNCRSQPAVPMQYCCAPSQPASDYWGQLNM